MLRDCHHQLEALARGGTFGGWQFMGASQGERRTVRGDRATRALGRRGQARGGAQLHERLVEVAWAWAGDQRVSEAPQHLFASPVAVSALDDEEPREHPTLPSTSGAWRPRRFDATAALV